MTSAPQELFSEALPQARWDKRAATPADRRLSHLKTLEAESIHILREAAAEFSRPVMLYSMGKDSAVMLHRKDSVSFAPCGHQL